MQESGHFGDMLNERGIEREWVERSSVTDGYAWL